MRDSTRVRRSSLSRSSCTMWAAASSTAASWAGSSGRPEVVVAVTVTTITIEWLSTDDMSTCVRSSSFPMTWTAGTGRGTGGGRGLDCPHSTRQAPGGTGHGARGTGHGARGTGHGRRTGHGAHGARGRTCACVLERAVDEALQLGELGAVLVLEEPVHRDDLVLDVHGEGVARHQELVGGVVVPLPRLGKLLPRAAQLLADARQDSTVPLRASASGGPPLAGGGRGRHPHSRGVAGGVVLRATAVSSREEGPSTYLRGRQGRDVAQLVVAHSHSLRRWVVHRSTGDFLQ